MSRFRKLSHTIWHCQYHIVWVPKYRYRVLRERIGEEVSHCIRAFSEQQKAEIVELNIQLDHVHLLVMVSPKVSVSQYVGTLKGRTAIRVFDRFRELKQRRYWGNRFWAGSVKLLVHFFSWGDPGIYSSNRIDGLLIHFI